MGRIRLNVIIQPLNVRCQQKYIPGKNPAKVFLTPAGFLYYSSTNMANRSAFSLWLKLSRKVSPRLSMRAALLGRFAHRAPKIKQIFEILQVVGHLIANVLQF